VIYPHLPVGMPCYDLTPVTDSLLFPPCRLSEDLNFRDLTGGECKEQGHIHGGMADPPLLAIPTSCSRVPDYNPNWGQVSRFAPSHDIASHCPAHCIIYDALDIRGMRIWHHPLLPLCYQSSILWHSNTGRGLRSLLDLTRHLAARADDDHAPPVKSFVLLQIIRFLGWHILCQA